MGQPVTLSLSKLIVLDDGTLCFQLYGSTVLVKTMRETVAWAAASIAPIRWQGRMPSAFIRVSPVDKMY